MLDRADGARRRTVAAPSPVATSATAMPASMVLSMRPAADSFEVRLPGAAALAVRVLGHAPATVRRRVLSDAFARAERAFNRGDLSAVFALFADNVEYVPPQAIYQGPPLIGRERVRSFWEQTISQFDESRITNLTIDETAPSRFVRTAELRHLGREQELRYRIRQVTELHDGRVIRQVNELLP